MIMIIIIIIINNNIVILWSRLKRFTLPGKLPLGASNNKFLKVHFKFDGNVKLSGVFLKYIGYSS